MSDITARGVADGSEARRGTPSETVTHDLAAASPGDDLDSVAEVMRAHGVRRLAVLDGNRLLGVISLSEPAIENDDRSALADIAANSSTFGS